MTVLAMGLFKEISWGSDEIITRINRFGGKWTELKTEEFLLSNIKYLAQSV